MKFLNIIMILYFSIFNTACERDAITLKGEGDNSSQESNTESSSPTSTNISPSNNFKNIETIIELNYTDPNSKLATSCDVSGLVNLTESTACSCSSGNCSVGVIGAAGYTGAASFNYTVTVDGNTSNIATVNYNIVHLGASTTEEWVKIPANTGGLGLPEFYIMKYEAKAFNDANVDSIIDAGEIDADGAGVTLATNVPVSIADNQPWASINANDSAARCQAIGANYHLISNSEWMAIARDIENVDANWTGGTVGSGCLFRGNSGEATCGYDAATDPDSGTSRNVRAKHTLSTGDELFDLGANLGEWVDWDRDTPGFQIGPTTCGGAVELPALACGDLVDSDYNTNNGSYNRTHGVGYFAGSLSGAGLRGDFWTGATNAGVFSLNLVGSPSMIANAALGFRCVYRP